MVRIRIDFTSLFTISLWLYVVTGAYGGKMNGQIAKPLMQVTQSRYALVALCIGIT